MIRLHRRFWLAFSACVVAAIAGMCWVTKHVLSLEDAECEARCEAEHQATLRLALWRVDSWLSAQLAPEAARPYFEYLAYYPPDKAYTRILGEIESGEVLTPSPLLNFQSDLFAIHFQLSSRTGLSSPQVPTGNQRDLAEGTFTDNNDFQANGLRLASLQTNLGLDKLSQRLQKAEFHCVMPAPPQQTLVADGQTVVGGKTVAPDYQYRQWNSNIAMNPQEQNRSWAALRSGEIALGSLLPVWLDDEVEGGIGDLVFVRRVTVAKETLFQGFVVDWDRLRDGILTQIADLFDPTSVRLTREGLPGQSGEGRSLTAVPVRLDVELPEVVTPSWSTTRTVVAAAWAAMLLAIIAIGLTLSSAISFGEKRARFASAVTHELRSPLTTFRMYSEMLAEDMVTDPEQRAEYLRTLERESGRLSRVVENVLAYARIEEGRHENRRERIRVDQLMERVVPTLEQRATESGFEARAAVEFGDAQVDVDVDAVVQVLFGLVDNACKYAANATDRGIDVSSALTDGAVELSVRDYGPGIADVHQKDVFRPFERGARSAGESEVPGVGLGLALARGLAGELGGELSLDPDVTDGARFVLRLPAVA